MVCGKSFTLIKIDLTCQGAENFLFTRIFSNQPHRDLSLTHFKQLLQSKPPSLACGSTTGSSDSEKNRFPLEIHYG